MLVTRWGGLFKGSFIIESFFVIRTTTTIVVISTVGVICLPSFGIISWTFKCIPVVSDQITLRKAVDSVLTLSLLVLILLNQYIYIIIQIPHEETFHSNTNMPCLKSVVIEKKWSRSTVFYDVYWVQCHQNLPRKAVDSV